MRDVLWIKQKIGNTTSRIELGSVIVSSGANFLLSLTALMRLGWQLNGNKSSLILREGNKQNKFQHQVKTEYGLLFVLRIIRDKSDELANPSVEETTEALKKKLNQSYSTKETDIHNEKRKAQKSEISN